MSKNILIFSDGTGQAGGLRPDQRLSNVYKLYRACRVGPDNDVDPDRQVAFYDPGLGSDQPDSSSGFRIVTAMRKFASSAIGAGIGRNIVDCYEGILKHYEDGDRIFLIGFSRGAYTARCVAGVLRLCGVPRALSDGVPVPRAGSLLREIAEEAVHKVYEHGSGRRRGAYEAERLELARRFRVKYGCDAGGKANVAPYFIGVFDTVAALGATGLRRGIMIGGLVVGGLSLSIALAALVAWIAGWTFAGSLAGIVAALAAFTGLKFVRSRLKFIRGFPDKNSFSWHWTGWRFGNYDTNFDSGVGLGRHALAIDERRADFQRVEWGQPSEGDLAKTPEGLERFVQLWFAGNHSDIGGSYPEDESRLSDIALSWMVGEAESLPHPIVVDHSKLKMYPSASGIQHCEVEALRDSYPRWWPRRLRKSWKVEPRYDASGAPYHPTVRERLALDRISECGRPGIYRPVALSRDPELAQLYAQKDADSCS